MDLKRLTASVAVAGKYINLNPKDARAAAEEAARSYRKAMINYSSMRVLDIWYDHIDLEELIDGLPDPEWQKRWHARLAKERARSAIEHDFPKLAAESGRRPRIKHNPPLIFHLDDERAKAFHKAASAAHYALRRFARAAIPRDSGAIQAG
jgi:hypothetical protein